MHVFRTHVIRVTYFTAILEVFIYVQTYFVIKIYA